jgi:hypothetical protein
MNGTNTAIIVNALLILLVILLAGSTAYRVKQGKWALPYSKFFMGSVAVLLGILALNVDMFVVSVRVPGYLKDGLFGAAGGLIGGLCFLTVAWGAVLLGLSWDTKDSEEVPQPNATAVDDYPRWFNRIAHFLCGLFVALALIMVFEQKESLTGAGMGMVFGAAFVYAGALIVYYVKRIAKK